MINYVSLLPGVVLWLTLTAIFAVLFVVVLEIFRAVSFFKGRMPVIMALCVSVLFITGFSQRLLVPGETYNAAGAYLLV